jgi:hypothetical protein
MLDHRSKRNAVFNNQQSQHVTFISCKDSPSDVIPLGDVEGFIAWSSSKRPNFPSGSSFGSSAIFYSIRPAAFRPLLMEGLALSGEPVQLLFFISEKVEFVNRKEGIVKIIF